MLFRFLGDGDYLALVAFIISILIALTVHEYAHARVAFAFGDDTARLQGRMSLNPVSHLDPIGTLMILFAGFGWARPVPVNYLRLRQLRKGILWISLAGPLSNFILAFFSVLVYWLTIKMGFSSDFFRVLMFTLAQLNIILGFFNLLPVPPLDGSKVLQTMLPPDALRSYQQIEPYGIIILLILIFTGAFGYILFPLTKFVLESFQSIVLFIINIF